MPSNKLLIRRSQMRTIRNLLTHPGCSEESKRAIIQRMKADNMSEKKLLRDEHDSNLWEQSPFDFQPNSLTTLTSAHTFRCSSTLKNLVNHIFSLTFASVPFLIEGEIKPPTRNRRLICYSLYHWRMIKHMFFSVKNFLKYNSVPLNRDDIK